jgi:hypothetical protein
LLATVMPRTRREQTTLSLGESAHGIFRRGTGFTTGDDGEAASSITTNTYLGSSALTPTRCVTTHDSSLVDGHLQLGSDALAGP